MGYFRPIGGQILFEATTTPTNPINLTMGVGAGGIPIAEPVTAYRVLIFDAASSAEVHLAYGPSVAAVNAIAGAGGAPTAGSQTVGIITFGGVPATAGAGFLDYIVLPSNCFISVWCPVGSADVYITPGQETAH